MSTPGPLPDNPDELGELIRRSRVKYLQGQKVLLARDRAEQRLRKRGLSIEPETAAQRAELEQELDDLLTGTIRPAEGMLAARITADGGLPLTPEQAGQFLRAIGASAVSLAAYGGEPEEMTAMLTRVLRSTDVDFETKLGIIASYMCDGLAAC